MAIAQDLRAVSARHAAIMNLRSRGWVYREIAEAVDLPTSAVERHANNKCKCLQREQEDGEYHEIAVTICSFISKLFDPR